MGLFDSAQVTTEYRTTWGTIKVEFPAGMTEGNRQTALDEMAAWERAPKRQVFPEDASDKEGGDDA